MENENKNVFSLSEEDVISSYRKSLSQEQLEKLNKKFKNHLFKAWESCWSNKNWKAKILQRGEWRWSEVAFCISLESFVILTISVH